MEVARGFRTIAVTRGVDLDPGATKKCVTPHLVSSSTIKAAQRWLIFGAFLIKPKCFNKIAYFLLYLLPFVNRPGAFYNTGA